MHDAHARYPVSIAIAVAWGDMDAFQHVNNVTYGRWLESARIAYFRRIGFMDRMRDRGVGPILARIAIDYRRPVTFPDTVRVDVTTKKIGKSSFTLGYRVWSEDQKAEVATGEDVIVVFDYRSLSKIIVDDELRAAIAAIEQSAATRWPAASG
jgi:acyl-CoA thioester hydrolase